MLEREQALFAAAAPPPAVAKKDGREYYFLICDICFWCASVLKSNLSEHREVISCPGCGAIKMQAIQFASNEE